MCSEKDQGGIIRNETYYTFLRSRPLHSDSRDCCHSRIVAGCIRMSYRTESSRSHTDHLIIISYLFKCEQAQKNHLLRPLKFRNNPLKLKWNANVGHLQSNSYFLMG